MFIATFACHVAAQASRVDASTLVGKVLVGYQGWFRCPGDGAPGNAWSHWSRGVPSAATVSVDAFPDTTGLSPASRCVVPGMTIQGKPAYVFSSWPRQTAQAHFQWMRKYAIDGALLQRFIADLDGLRRENDVVLQNLRQAAEDSGRTFAIEYDFSMDYAGVSDEALLARVQADWRHLVDDLRITASPSYQHHAARPLVSLWGLGFGDNRHVDRPALAQRLVAWFKSQGLAVMGGVPGGWRAGSWSSSAAPGWAAVYASLDVVQPWTVGSYTDAAGADWWRDNMLAGDIAQARASRQMYMPVIFPGFSWHNLYRTSPLNQIPREGGQFLWRQASNARDAGAQTVKIAMFDEVNEGTALFDVAAMRGAAPDQGSWLTLDADGYALPADWYLRLGYEIAKVYSSRAPNSATVPGHPGPDAPAATCGIVASNRPLAVDTPIRSCDGRFDLTLQSDGNLVLYQGRGALWSSRTAGHRVGWGMLQDDGNLVIYDGAGMPYWSTRTAGHPNTRLAIQDDGNLVIYQGKQVIWSSASCCH